MHQPEGHTAALGWPSWQQQPWAAAGTKILPTGITISCLSHHASQPNLVQSPPDVQNHAAETPTYVLLLQVYSPEVLRAFGKALVGLLRDTALYMRAMQAAGIPHDSGEWLPRLIFLLLQNPLNGETCRPSNLSRVVVAAETYAAMPRTCMRSGARL